MIIVGRICTLNFIKFLIQCDWTMAGQQQGVFKKSHAIQQALIAAASMGYTEVRKQGSLRGEGGPAKSAASQAPDPSPPWDWSGSVLCT